MASELYLKPKIMHQLVLVVSELLDNTDLALALLYLS